MARGLARGLKKRLEVVWGEGWWFSVGFRRRRSGGAGVKGGSEGEEVSGGDSGHSFGGCVRRSDELRRLIAIDEHALCLFEFPERAHPSV